MSRRTQLAEWRKRFGDARPRRRFPSPEAFDDAAAQTGLDASAIVDGVFQNDVTFQGVVSIENPSGTSTILLDPVGGLSAASVSSTAGIALTDARWTHLTKAANTSRASTTIVVLDPDLQFATASGTTYEFMCVLTYAQASAGAVDLSVAMGEDTTTRGVWSYHEMALGFGTVATATSSLAVMSSATTKHTLQLWGVHIGGGGTFGVWWAQTTGSIINLTVYQSGSHLFYRAL